MEVSVKDKNRKEKQMDRRFRECVQRSHELQNLLREHDLTEHCYNEAKARIDKALKMINAFAEAMVETEIAEKEKLANEALENAERYLRIGIVQELTSMIQETDQREREFLEKIEEKLKETNDKSQMKKSEDKWVHILHLSDLHFGIYVDKDADEEADKSDDIINRQDEEDFKEIVERSLFKFLKDYLSNNRKIDIVAITGDITFCNKKIGYDDFKKWLEKLCGILDVKIEDEVVICPGNHDSGYKNRALQGIHPLKGEKHEADEKLTIDRIEERKEQFRSFNNVCEKLKIGLPVSFNDAKAQDAVAYTMGIKNIKDVRFVILNSAWNAFPDKSINGSDHGQLVLGGRLMESMFRNTKIPKGEMTAMLFHHPISYLHETEIRTYGLDQKKISAAMVRQNAGIVLNGHVHGKIEPPDILANKTVVFGGGTLYSNDSHLHEFEIISVNMTKHYCTQRVVRYNRQEENSNWELSDEEENFGWELTEQGHPPRIYYGVYREAQDLLLRYNLGELTRKEAETEASERSKGIFRQTFDELLVRSRVYQISDILDKNRDLLKDFYNKRTAFNTLEKSGEKKKTLT